LSLTQPWTQEQATDGQLVSGPVTDPFTGLDAPPDAPPGTGLVTSPGGADPVGTDPAATETGMRCGYYC
jgi:hypothetical protein